MTVWLKKSGDRVTHISLTDPAPFADRWIVCENDDVCVEWYIDENNQVSQFAPLSVDDIRTKRNKLLAESDWMVLSDSPYRASGQESNLATIETYRQALRDFPDDSRTDYTEETAFPTLTLS